MFGTGKDFLIGVNSGDLDFTKVKGDFDTPAVRLDEVFTPGQVNFSPEATHAAREAVIWFGGTVVGGIFEDELKKIVRRNALEALRKYSQWQERPSLTGLRIFMMTKSDDGVPKEIDVAKDDPEE